MLRFVIGLLALPLLAQMSWVLPEPPARALVPDAKSLRVMRLPLTPNEVTRNSFWSARNPKTNQPVQKPCAIPLVNSLRFRDADPPIRKFSPPPYGMREFPVPAPSCEDRERR
jgi:hypothetical protein